MPSASSPTSPTREGLWLHVDAAYGAAARLSPRDAARVPDLERAEFGDGRPAQVAVPGLRHRRPDGPRRLRRSRQASAAAGPSTTAPGTARDGDEGAASAASADDDDDDGHGAADQLNFWRLGFEGTRRLARAQAVALLEARRVRPASPGWSRRTTTWPPTSRHGSPHRTTSRRCPPCRRSRSCASGTSRTDGPAPPRARRRATRSTRTRTGSSRRSRRPARAGSRPRGSAAATYLRAGILNTQSTIDDVDDLLALLRRLAGLADDGVRSGRAKRRRATGAPHATRRACARDRRVHGAAGRRARPRRARDRERSASSSHAPTRAAAAGAWTPSACSCSLASRGRGRRPRRRRSSCSGRAAPRQRRHRPKGGGRAPSAAPATWTGPRAATPARRGARARRTRPRAASP